MKIKKDNSAAFILMAIGIMCIGIVCVMAYCGGVLY